MGVVLIVRKPTVLIPVLALTVVGVADFSHVEVHDMSAVLGTPADLVTWRYVAVFTPPFQQVFAVGPVPDSAPVSFATNDPRGLVNEGGPFSGQKQEDFAFFPLSAAWDSWVTVGSTDLNGNCTDYPPDFLDSDGTNAVIVGTSWSDRDDGWYDAEPQTIESGRHVAIAQFTVRRGFGVRLSGAVYSGEIGSVELSAFSVTSPDFLDCPVDLDGNGFVDFEDVLRVLSNWGVCDEACPEDLDDDRTVGFSDLVIVLGAWGPCPS